ncbi:1484_t:CDS:2 [Funneliformis geosporum]|uniref:1484_t:CDS:1 n=1 Tax=Funneliformis geosporum TaxID=1117311 RepID=A0A9W4WKA4_9GLOM|nr:1484_t:CDS:2 [Funneliformis geosporum]
MTDFQQEKKKLTEALSRPVKISTDINKADEELKKHIGFKEEKETFLNHIRAYCMTQGRFFPIAGVICYSSAPGMGKTTFVHNLANAMGRDCETIPLAGFKQSEEFSILGDDTKPMEDKKVQADLIKLFQDYKAKKKFFDKYFQTEIDLRQITFFATVNYIDDLSLDLKKEININELPDFSEQEKKDILKMKAEEINQEIKKKYPEEKNDIITEKMITEILKRISEVGVRQAERVLYKEYNQELAKNSAIKENNTIDFAKENQREKEFIENKIKEIIDLTDNKQEIEQGKFPII